MKKTLVALATLAVAGGAFAQSPMARNIDASGVTIFGVADASVRRISADGNGSLTIMDGTGTGESTRLGFRGVEDMGGGWGAGFWLEMAYDQDRGTGSNTTSTNTRSGDAMIFNSSTTTTAATATAAGAGPITPATQSLGGRQGLTFNRAATVSLLNKGFGEIRFGRDYSATFWNMTGYDPFGTVGSGSALNVIAGPLATFAAVNAPPGGAVPTVRTSNAISWLSTDMSGLRLQAQMALAESPTTCTTPQSSGQTTYCPGASGDGRLTALRALYNSGSFSGAVAYGIVTYGNTAAQTQPGITIAAQTLSAGTATGNVSTSPFGASSAYTGNMTTFNLGGSYTMGATKLFGQYGTIQREANVSTVAQKLSYNLLGVSHAFGALTLKGSYATATRADGSATTGGTLGATNNNAVGYEDGSKVTQVAAGAVYDLSKRTALYGTYSVMTVTAGTFTGGSLRANMALGSTAIGVNASAATTGIDVGIRHRF